MANYNHIVVMGHLTRDPELKTFDNGGSIANFGIAMNERWTDRETGEVQERVDFVDIEASNNHAENIMQYFQKGKPILVEGKLRQQRWEDADGNSRSKHVIRLFSWRFVGSAASEEEAADTQPGTPPVAEIPEDQIPY